MSKVVYISGPMTGLPEYNYPEFNRVERTLVEKGYTVINPTKTGVQKGWEWKDYLIADLILLLTNGVDVVVTLEGWEGSRGASLEVYVADKLEIEVTTFKKFISR